MGLSGSKEDIWDKGHLSETEAALLKRRYCGSSVACDIDQQKLFTDVPLPLHSPIAAILRTACDIVGRADRKVVNKGVYGGERFMSFQQLLHCSVCVYVCVCVLC
eukprot:GHVR01034029.1.p1 GENE.GHVR01034029.1~~GHVR01034029.1.p1  ORF type:complete len:105 (-),score=28.69 GHVR01034029.1:195-509(-)